MTFRYLSFTVDAGRGLLNCRYEAGGREFTERVTLSPGERWHSPAARAAARLVFLLAGVSYYKTTAADVIDLGEIALTARERDFLRAFYLHGLAEFAHRNAITVAPRIYAPAGPLSSVPIAQSSPLERADCAVELPAGPAGPAGVAGVASGADGAVAGPKRPLVPFGGGIDSIVTVEQVRRRAEDVALFVVSRPGDTYDAIERPAEVTGLPVIRAERRIDPQLLDRDNGFLNGHVPVTGIVSAIAVLAAVLDGRDAVVMSNEWSSSIPTLAGVNHQWSKSAEFEQGFREVITGALPDYFSWLRDRTELWVGREFAALTQYHGTFRSCNKAFYADRARRLDHWCGECDKCCFIDLILAPFLTPGQLAAIFQPAGEPLRNPVLKPKFLALLGAGAKPFECVGEVSECRAALLRAARRDDRQHDTLLPELAAQTRSWPDAPSDADAEAMLRPVGESFVPAGWR